MGPHPYGDAFASTTPPSDFDDFDLSTMLACSPAIPKVRCLTPESLHRPHSSSLSSDSTYLTGDLNMSFPNDEASQEIYYSNASNAQYYPLPMPSLQDDLSFNPNDTYANYEETQWIPITNYSNTAMVSYSDTPPSSIYPSFSTPSVSSNPNIPSVPHSISDQTNFNFSSVPQQTLQTQSYLAASPAFSQTHSAHSHSRAGSIPSLSRSCSPNPSLFSGNTPTRSTLTTSTAASTTSSSTNLDAYGILVSDPGSSSNSSTVPQTWRCAYPGCTSRAVFTRGCDLRKHYNRHSKHLFCRVDGCPQSTPRHDVSDGRRGSLSASGGFSSKKDRARHEAKHNPGIRCEWAGADGEECGRVFSRMDNMKDHVRRIHRKGSR